MNTLPAPQPGAGRLLLVDDEENILRSIRRVLRKGNWEIEVASDGPSALQVFESFRPEVVISDFRMPGMNGVELLTRVKDLDPQTQRIMLTGQADPQAIEEAINRSEIFRFISKPWNDQQLVLTVKSAFEQSFVLRDNARLHELTQDQNAALRNLNADLEQRVILRTQMLTRAKREWETTFDTIDQPVAVVQSDDLTLLRANRAYARAAGKGILEVVHRPKCHQFLFDRSEPCPGCPMARARQTQAPAQGEIQHRGRTHLLAVYPMDHATAVCSYRDVTDERVATARLTETEKMAAVGSLAGGVAHEINNPLGGILAFSQLMKRDPGRSANDLESLSLIEESALRCKRIVESLLKFSRRSHAADKRAFDISRCIEDTALLFRAQLKGYPKVKLDLSLAPQLPEVHGDPGQLSQVALNLLQNGLQALVDQEGTLKVETGARPGEVFFKVSDNGSGIRPEHLGRVFEPHFTTKPPGEGTGLGLAIAYRIVQDHGGTLEVDSEPAKGTCFCVRIPVQARGGSGDERDDGAEAGYQGPGGRR